jgi:hypothetical protein
VTISVVCDACSSGRHFNGRRIPLKACPFQWYKINIFKNVFSITYDAYLAVPMYTNVPLLHMMKAY